jgi:3-oxoacyl-[acyl-carrier-protein] synthase II
MSVPPRPAVSGIGLITPIGAEPESFWSSLIDGRSGAAAVRSFDTGELPHRIGCEAGPVTLDAAVRAAIGGGRCTELAAAAVGAAVRDAGVETGLRETPSAAVVVGTTMGEVTRFERERAEHPEREPDVHDVHFLAHRPLESIARSLARIYGLHGPTITVPAACAAGSYAIGVAASLVRRGVTPMALAVGTEAFSRLAFVGFSRMRAMSADACRPFSLDRPGLLLGEGAGALVIEDQAALLARGAEPWGFVDGFGLSCDAHHVTGPHPHGEGAVRAMRDALARAGVEAERVDHVNAHGTGTTLNDRTESLAVGRVFGARRVPVSSIKALTGHMMGAAGSVEAIASLLAMRHGVIPPTWNWVAADPDCDVDCVSEGPRPARLHRVLSNSYAFGGNNASLLLSSPDSAGAQP